MSIFLTIYIIGVIAALWTYYYSLEKGHEVSLAELLAVVISCLFASWFAFGIIIMLRYGSETVFKKK